MIALKNKKYQIILSKKIKEKKTKLKKIYKKIK